MPFLQESGDQQRESIAGCPKERQQFSLKIMSEITVSYGPTVSKDLATLLLGSYCDEFVRKVFDTCLNQDDDDSTRSTAPCTWEQLCCCVEDTSDLPGSLVKEIRNQFCS